MVHRTSIAYQSPNRTRETRMNHKQVNVGLMGPIREYILENVKDGPILDDL
jgi:hypothetical protein